MIPILTGEFPDCEDVMCNLVELVDELAGKGFNELPGKPEELGALLPLAWCFKIGGTCDGITDRPLITTCVFAETRTHALRLSGLVRETVLNAGGYAVGGVLIDAADEKNGIKLQPAPLPKLPMIAATYQLSFRRQ